MPLTFPRAPRTLQEVLRWAQSATPILRSILPQDSEDYWAQTTGGGTSFKRRRRGGQAVRPWDNFQVLPCAPPNGETTAAGPWFYVSKNSWLMGYDSSGQPSSKPTDKISIGGLGIDGAFQCQTNSAPWTIYLEINVQPLQTPATPTVTLKNAKTWDPSGFSLFPTKFYYNTDDGTPNGSSGTAPANNYQTYVMVPLAYLVDPNDDDFKTAKQFGIPITSSMSLMQQCFTNLFLASTCFGGINAIDVIPAAFAPQPTWSA